MICKYGVVDGGSVGLGPQSTTCVIAHSALDLPGLSGLILMHTYILW